MTTLAWDGKHLAADRQVSLGGDFPCYVGNHCKIRKVTRWLGQSGDQRHDYFVVTAGRVLDGQKFESWVEHYLTMGGTYPKLSEGFIGLVMDCEGRVKKYLEDSDGWGEDITDTPSAFGNAGRDFAMGVMAYGGSAMKAVELASGYCLFTGGGVDYVSVDDQEIKQWTVEC